MKLINNLGGGNCGVYAVMDALSIKRDQLQQTRNTIAIIIKNFITLHQYKGKDNKFIITKYKEIFGDEGFANFSFAVLKSLNSSLNSPDNSEDTRNSIEKKIKAFKDAKNWEDAEKIEYDILHKTKNYFEIEIGAIIHDHGDQNLIGLYQTDKDNLASEYETYSSKDGVWLNNSELAGYFLTKGYVFEESCDDKENGGKIIKFINSQGNIIGLHNDAGKNQSEQNKSDGNHWQAIDFAPPKLQGLSKSIHGNIFQLRLLTIAAIRAQKKLEEAPKESSQKEFKLISEDADNKVFDDLVLEYDDKVIMLQAKHSFTSGDKYTEANLLASPSQKNNDISLAKYFNAWYKLKQKESNKDKEVQYIFFTNKGIKNNSNFLEEFSIPKNDDLFFFENDTRAKTLKFKKDANARENFITAIRSHSTFKVKNDEQKQIDINDFPNELQEALNYIIEKSKQSKQSKFTLDRRSGKNSKVRSIIKYLHQNPEIAKEKFSTHPEYTQNTETKIQNWIKQTTLKCDDDINKVLDNSKDELINAFLDELIFKINQPSRDDLISIIQHESPESFGGYEWIKAQEYYMWEWLSSNNYLLKTTDWEKFTALEKDELNRFYFLQSTHNFTLTYKDQNCSEALHLAQLKDILKQNSDTEKVKIIKLIDEGGGVELRLCKTIQSIVTKISEWIYTDHNTLLSYQKENNLLNSILQNKTTNIIVINCLQENGDINGLIEAIQNQKIANYKKIVLILSKNIKIENADTISCPALQESDVTSLLKEKNALDKYIQLGNTSYKLQSCLGLSNTGIHKLMHNLDHLQQIINLSEENAYKYKSSLPYDIYVPNELVSGKSQYYLSDIIEVSKPNLIVIDNMSDEDLESFVANYKNKTDEKQSEIESDPPKRPEVKFINNPTTIKTDKNIIYLTNTQETIQKGIKKICAKRILKLVNNKEVEKDIDNKYLLDITESDESLTLPNIQELNYCSTQKESIDSDDNKSDEIREELFKISGISILAANAGHGKTSFCSNIISEISSKNKEMQWVIKIELSKLKFDKEDPDLFDAFNSGINSQFATSINWDDCQLEAFKHDLLPDSTSKIIFFLDGLDEIKNERQLIRINKWLDKIPSRIFVLICTRSYAEHEINLINKRKINYHLTLKKYTLEQQKDYVNQYIKAILKTLENENHENAKNDDKTNYIIQTVSSKLESKANSSTIISIPLESYLYCESLKLVIRQYINSGDECYFLKDEDFHFRTTNLFQNFISTKLDIALQKHLKVSKEYTLTSKSILYNFSKNYLDIFMIMALKQTFFTDAQQQDKQLIRQVINTCYIDENIIGHINDVGIGKLLNNTADYSVNFNHETYKEYFAALFIMRSILVESNQLESIIETAIKSNSYNPKFRVILTLLVELCLNGNDLFPDYSVYKKEAKIQQLLKMIFSKTDLLGSATVYFYNNITESLSIEKLNILKKLVPEKVAEQVNKLRIYTLDESEFSIKTDNHQEPSAINTSVEIQPEALMNKGTVVTYTQDLINNRKCSLEILAQKFAEVIKHEDLNSYWDIDGGFMAISFLGNYFNDNLANYFIERTANDPIWRVTAAVNALLNLRSNYTLKGNAQKAYMKVVCKLISIQEYRSDSLNQSLKKLIDNDEKQFFRYLEEKLNQQLSQIYTKFFNSSTSAITNFENILYLAYYLNYLCYIESDKIILEKNEKITINIDEKFNSFFTKNLLGIKIHSDHSNYIRLLITLPERSDKLTTFAINAIDNSNGALDLYQRLIELRTSRIRTFKNKEEVDPINARNAIELLEVFKELSEKDMIDHNIADYLNEQLGMNKATEFYSNWHYYGGTELIGYMGKYLSNEMVAFLTKDFYYRKDLHIKQLKNVLKKLYTELSKNAQNPEFTTAIKNYNYCIEYHQFSEFPAIDIPGAGESSKLTENNAKTTSEKLDTKDIATTDAETEESPIKRRKTDPMEIDTNNINDQHETENNYDPCIAGELPNADMDLDS